ncbi:hypothetical protein [Rhodococcus koreensis]
MLTAIGTALAYGAVPAIIMRAVPVAETAAANSLNTLARTLGTASCSAVVVAITSVAVVEMAGGSHTTALAYATVFAVGAIAALAAGLVALTIPGRRRMVPRPMQLEGAAIAGGQDIAGRNEVPAP